MKKIKNLKAGIGMSTILLLLFFSGCKKDQVNTESDVISASDLKEITSLKFTILSDTIPRISKTISSKTLAKMKAILTQKDSNTKDHVLDNYFTATLWAPPSIYHCLGEVNMSGPLDWYLVDMATSTFNHVASSSGSSMEYYFDCTTPGYYRLWAVNSNEDFDLTDILYFQ